MNFLQAYPLLWGWTICFVPSMMQINWGAVGATEVLIWPISFHIADKSWLDVSSCWTDLSAPWGGVNVDLSGRVSLLSPIAWIFNPLSHANSYLKEEILRNPENALARFLNYIIRKSETSKPGYLVIQKGHCYVAINWFSCVHGGKFFPGSGSIDGCNLFRFRDTDACKTYSLLSHHRLWTCHVPYI